MLAVKKILGGLSDRALGFALTRLFEHFHGTQMLMSAGLAIHGASSALVKAANAFVAMVSRIPVYVAANTDMAALVGPAVPTGNSCMYLFGINSGGVVSCYAGEYAATVGGVKAPKVVPEGVAIIGGILVQNATGSDFTPGTTALDTASLTVTYFNNVGPFFPVSQL